MVLTRSMYRAQMERERQQQAVDVGPRPAQLHRCHRHRPNDNIPKTEQVVAYKRRKPKQY